MRLIGLSVGVGLGIGIPAKKGAIARPVAPVLTWTSNNQDDTADFSIALTGPQDGDIVELQVSNAADFSGTIDTVESGDTFVNPVLLSAVSLLNGTWYARAKLTRGSVDSLWSNTVVVTIAIAAAAPTLAWTSAANVPTPGFSVTLASYLASDSIITQVATDNGFASIVDTITTAYVGANPTLQTGASRADGTYYARSRIDRGGVTGAYSSTINFTLSAFTFRQTGLRGVSIQTTALRTYGVPGFTIYEAA